MPIPLAGFAAGALLQNPTVQGGIGRGVRHIGGGLSNMLQGLGSAVLPEGMNQSLNDFLGAVGGGRPEDMTPEQIAQQDFLQQIRQPINIPFDQQRQQLIDQFNQQTVPGLAHLFTGMGEGAQHSSAFAQQLGAAGSNLGTNLGALQEGSQLQQQQLNQNRLGQLGGYLGGQQQLGMQAQQLGQQGSISQQNAALERMKMMTSLLGGLGQMGTAGTFDTGHTPGEESPWEKFAGGALRGFTSGGRR